MSSRHLSDEDIDAIVDRSMERVFEGLGIDINNIDHRLEFRQNMEWIQRLRTSTSGIWSILVNAGVLAAIGALGFLIMEGIKSAILALKGGQ